MKIILGIIIVGFAIAIVFILFVSTEKPLGQATVYDYWSNATNSSSSVPSTATTSNPILSLDVSRNDCHICNNGAYTVFLHPLGISTTTGVAVNTGIPLSPIGLTTSTANVCWDFPNFRGYLFGIAAATTFVTVSCH